MPMAVIYEYSKENDGDQLAVFVHVDNLMIACKNRKDIDNVIHGLHSD